MTKFSTKKTVKSNISLRQLVDIDESDQSTLRYDNIRHGQVLVSYVKTQQAKTFSFKYLSSLLQAGDGIIITNNNDGTATIQKTTSYGAWQTDVSQTAALSNVGYPVQYVVPDVTPNGVSIELDSFGNPTKITFAVRGVYLMSFTCQFSNSDTASEHDTTIWLRKNGETTAEDVAGSAGFVSIPKKTGGANGHAVPARSYMVEAEAGDFFQIIWSTDNASKVVMQYYAAGSPPPSAASAILNVNSM